MTPVVQTSTTAPVSLQFADITQTAGISFKHNNGAFGAFLMPEIMGGGLGFVDYDSDGYPDLFVVNGRDWSDAEFAAFKNGSGKTHPELTSGPRQKTRSTCALYHNNGDGTFKDVTREAGLDVEMYGMGVAIGDYDNDGKPDVYVTALGRNYLFHNDGGGKFSERAQQAGVKDGGWSTSAAWLDYDKDGTLDLFVCHYVDWNPRDDIYCQSAGHNKDYCTPEAYQGEFCRLYRGLSGGKFEDVSKKAGMVEQKTPDGRLRKCQGKSLGVALCDFNNDGWVDLVVANDTEPNYLFQNNEDGTFTEIGREAGVALSESGIARAAMGVDTADIDRSGRESILFGNFSNQMLGLYQNQGNSLFIDTASPAGVGQPSLKFLAFGAMFADFDNDGWPDIFTANGHVEAEVEQKQRDVTFKERPLLFRNLGKGQFAEIGPQAGDALQKPVVGRGAVYADIDLDGDLDLAVLSNGEGVTLLRNDGGNKNGAIRLVLEGVKSNRSAIGAVVETKAGKDIMRSMIRSGGSYCSASDLALTVGLGTAAKADSVTISWPSGAKTELPNVEAGKMYVINEDKGIVRSVALKK